MLLDVLRVGRPIVVVWLAVAVSLLLSACSTGSERTVELGDVLHVHGQGFVVEGSTTLTGATAWRLGITASRPWFIPLEELTSLTVGVGTTPVWTVLASEHFSAAPPTFPEELVVTEAEWSFTMVADGISASRSIAVPLDVALQRTELCGAETCSFELSNDAWRHDLLSFGLMRGDEPIVDAWLDGFTAGARIELSVELAVEVQTVPPLAEEVELRFTLVSTGTRASFASAPADAP